MRDRRSTRRFELNLELECRILKGKKTIRCEAGATSNIASGGVLFQTREPVPAGSRVELTVSWPVAVGEMLPVDLVLLGTVVRNGDGWVAVRIARYAFRTKGLPVQRQRAAPSSSENEVA